MKPLITTVRALGELATGLSPDAISASPVLFEFNTPAVDFLVAADDDEEVQRIVIMREENAKDPYVPEHLVGLRRDVLSRMTSFAERARTPGPLSLPRQWHQYKHDNYVAFFAVPKPDVHASRWITEVTSGDRADVIFWSTTTSNNKSTIEDFEKSNRSAAPQFDDGWAQALAAAKNHFTQERPEPSDVEISLPALEQSTTKGWTYEQWLAAVSSEQRAFIEASTDKSIRLRGPAGSGKTLALTLKAIREVLNVRDAGGDVRVLVVTHSWALAAQISDSIDSMGLGLPHEIDVFPLLEIAKTVSPQYTQDASGFNLIGEDSLSGKQAQLDQILEVLDDFITGEWITYKGLVSDNLRSRFDSAEKDERLALAWDLLIEFGSVIGTAAIFPGAGSDLRYFQLPRASWMLPLKTRDDLRVIFELYSRYMASLDARSLVTSDQVLADFLSHLETHAWNRARRSQGYDLVFVDEFHLFSPLERQVLHYLTRDTSTYPHVFMAVDPRQSPSEAFIGPAADETRSSSSAAVDDSLGDVANFELTTIHRFTPQILDLIKHVHHEFPTFDLGHDWDIDFTRVESVQDDGPLPRLISAASRSGEEMDIFRAVQKLYPSGRLALAVVDTHQWQRFSDLASRIGHSGKFHVSTVSGRSDIEGLGYRRRGLVVGPAEYLAGLQFDSVIVAGIPNLNTAAPTANERTRRLSLLYLALSRAQREVRVCVNEDDGGAAEVLLRAVANNLMEPERGSLV
ncbi:AAA family ATPase [Streptomyces sp. Je 1-4]|uniref:UvrD-helicase domain-containing protein n=1 Tax=Streptomyces TaxID=1883 RepID=UPI0021D89845|nr:MULTISPECIES: UvrD-helicase domain-containing protein [unclassified Streptomyces]UYB40594.1 AAA family ATPase [Streptomyces sp. Je 1-4]UZQ36729.1 AAA family ATPase [Streptomyces sp. Je 1-4] [Streptomyces sp. Je 1-4 4N24]UZQ44146.1 AAA family ATPase [Streptomyces sp. Je 1-4] [Streptomyces sp. Je 1-4 4N24_ara]